MCILNNTPLRAHLISFYKLQPNQTFALTEKCCPGEKELCKDRLSDFLCRSAESSKKLESLTWKFRNSLYNIQFCCVYIIKFKKKKQLKSGRSFWECLLQLERKIACQNVNILLLIDKHAARIHQGINYSRWVAFFYLPAAWLCPAIRLRQIIKKCVPEVLGTLHEAYDIFLMWWEISLLLGTLTSQK